MLRSALLVSVGLLGALAADEEQSPAPPEAPASPEAPADYAFPDISALEDVVLLEDFQGDWEAAWVYTKKEPYSGSFRAEGYAVDAIPGDLGLVMTQEARRYGLTRKLPDAVATSVQPLVFQYEVALKNGLECGGAYVKLLNVDASFDGQEFDEPTPYSIMFGPDKCANAGKIHFIIKFKNPVTGEWSEHHLKNGPAMPPTTGPAVTTHLYRFALLGGNKVSISVDDKAGETFSLLEDFEPPINPPKHIDDPDDSKPEDWVDEARIEDPDAKKPDDWDEDAPFQIPDPKAVKPEGWHDDAPAMIPDPKATMPDDWDEDEDGENPGCGEWQPPMIDNPDYKGKWYPPMIDNPAYKGEFKPRQIDNPAYFEDKHPDKSLAPIGAVGFELWTMQNGILFDNVVIARSEAAAKEIAAKTWAVRHKAEMAAAEEKAKEARKGDGPGSDWKSQVVHYAALLADLVAENPVPAGITACAGLAAFLLVLCMPRRGERARGAARPSAAATPASEPPVNDDKPSGSGSGDKAEEKPRATRRTPKAD